MKKLVDINKVKVKFVIKVKDMIHECNFFFSETNICTLTKYVLKHKHTDIITLKTYLVKFD